MVYIEERKGACVRESRIAIAAKLPWTDMDAIDCNDKTLKAIVNTSCGRTNSIIGTSTNSIYIFIVQLHQPPSCIISLHLSHHAVPSGYTTLAAAMDQKTPTPILASFNACVTPPEGCDCAPVATALRMGSQLRSRKPSSVYGRLASVHWGHGMRAPALSGASFCPNSASFSSEKRERGHGVRLPTDGP